MSCYCYNLLVSDHSTFLKSTFEDLGGPGTPNYCAEWLTTYSLAQFIVYGSALLVVGINMVAQEIFILVAQFERQWNSALENQSIFTLIFMQQFTNIGIILIFTDRNFLNQMEFDSDWYIQIGTQICFTMVIQTFSTKGSDLGRILFHLALRFFDRGF